MWDPEKFYDDLEHSIFEKKIYMWDPTEFYDNFEHSIFEKKIYMWDPTEFYDNFEHSIFEIKYTCWTKVGLWCYCGAYGVTKQASNRDTGLH
jgi:hypothetical protein